MPTRHIKLPTDPPQTLKITWKIGPNAIQLSIDGKALGSPLSVDDLKAGFRTELDDGGQLRVWTEPGWYTPLTLKTGVSIDSATVPGTVPNTARDLKAGMVIAFLMAVGTFMGVGALVQGASSSVVLGIGLGLALAFAAAGIFISRGSRVAAILVFAYSAIDTALVVTAAGHKLSIIWVLVRSLFLLLLLRAVMAANIVAQQRKRRARTE